jgi:uncharacterized C2H2 Zn-finger protein
MGGSSENYPCPKDGEKIYFNCEALDIHLKTHGENLICDKCGGEFMSEREYYEHLGKAHNLFPLGRRFFKTPVKTEEKQMKEYPDRRSRDTASV